MKQGKKKIIVSLLLIALCLSSINLKSTTSNAITAKRLKIKWDVNNNFHSDGIHNYKWCPVYIHKKALSYMPKIPYTPQGSTKTYYNYKAMPLYFTYSRGGNGETVYDEVLYGDLYLLKASAEWHYRITIVDPITSKTKTILYKPTLIKLNSDEIMYNRDFREDYLHPTGITFYQLPNIQYKIETGRLSNCSTQSRITKINLFSCNAGEKKITRYYVTDLDTNNKMDFINYLSL